MTGIEPLSHSLLTGILTGNGLRNAYLGIILPVLPICKIVSFIMSWTFLTMPCMYHMDLGFHCSLQFSLKVLPGPQPPCLKKEDRAPGGPQLLVLEPCSWHLLFLGRPAFVSFSVCPSYFNLGYHTGTTGNYGSYHHGVQSIHRLHFQAPCLPKRTFTCPKCSIDSVRDFIQLCSPRQSLVKH